MADNIVDRITDGEPRRVIFGDIFNSDDLARGLVVLNEVPPLPEPPEEEQVEPWGLGDDAPEEKYQLFRGRLRHYLRDHGHGH